jgi:hypothetical protein
MRYYYLSGGGEVRTGLFYRHQINSNYFRTFKEAKQYALRYIANQMNNLLDAMREYVERRKKLVEQKKV